METLSLYKISYLYYPVIGSLTVVIVALIVSRWTGMNKPRDVDPELLSPVIRKYCTREKKEKNYYDDEGGLEMLNIKLMKNHKVVSRNRNWQRS